MKLELTKDEFEWIKDLVGARIEDSLHPDLDLIALDKKLQEACPTCGEHIGPHYTSCGECAS